MLTASSECPVCGVDTPHVHSDDDIERWVNSLISRWGRKAEVFVERERQEYLARAWDNGYAASRADAAASGWNTPKNPYHSRGS